MAVEARQIDLFPSQLISHRDFIKSNQVNANLCNTQMDSYLPFFETMAPAAADAEHLLPFYQTLDCNNQINSFAKTSMEKADSGLTYNLTTPAAPRSTKRLRDSNSIYDLSTAPVSQKTKLSSFLDEDIIFHFQQRQSEIDRHIAHHVEKVRRELEERRQRQSRMLLSAIQEGIIKKLKEKDDEIQRMGKLNWVLQERVKSLYVENQIWRDLAQTNEATANSLRSNLEQVLAHVSEEHGGCEGNDDAESSCGSSGSCGVDQGARDKMLGVNNDSNSNSNSNYICNRMCRRCGERESSVLVLPCRHLCLCSLCGSSLLGSCPVCSSLMDASLHVNLS